MVKWWKVSEKLPDHQEQVLVRQGDDIELAVYDAAEKVFVLRSGKKVLPTAQLLWLDLLRDTHAI